MRSVVEDSPSDLPAMVGFAESCSLLGDDALAEEALTAARSLDRDLPESLADAAATHLPGHRVVRTMDHPAPVQSLRLAGGGRVVVRTAVGEAVVWQPAGDLPASRIQLDGPARQGRSMAVAGDTLVTCQENAPLALFNLATGSRVRSLRPHPGVAICVELSPDASKVASGGSDRVLRVWNLSTGECEMALQGHEAFITALAWHPTEPWVATASADGTARLWHLDQARCLHVFEGHSGPVRSLAFGGTGERLLVTAGQDGILEDLGPRNRQRSPLPAGAPGFSDLGGGDGNLDRGGRRGRDCPPLGSRKRRGVAGHEAGETHPGSGDRRREARAWSRLTVHRSRCCRCRCRWPRLSPWSLPKRRFRENLPEGKRNSRSTWTPPGA